MNNVTLLGDKEIVSVSGGNTWGNVYLGALGGAVVGEKPRY